MRHLQLSVQKGRFGYLLGAGGAFGLVRAGGGGGAFLTSTWLGVFCTAPDGASAEVSDFTSATPALAMLLKH